MGTAKTDLFTEKENEIANLTKALGHPARIAIIEYLARVKVCICGDIVDELPLAQATISQHLKALKNAGFIKGEISGNRICYCLNKEAVTAMQDYFEGLAAQLENTNNCC